MSGELDVFTALADWSDGETPSQAKLNQQIRDNPNVLGLVVAGDKSAVRTHRHRRGTFANRPAAGNLNRYYFATDQGGRYFDDGTTWQLVGHHPDLADRIHDDFQVVGGAPNTLTIGDLAAPGPWGHGWWCEDVGSGGSEGNVGRLSTAQGSVMAIQARSAVGAGWRVSPRGFDQPIMHADQMAPLVMDCFYFVASIPNNDHFVGVADVLPFARPMAPTIGCGFRYTSSVGKYEAYTATTGKTTQITDTGVVPKLDKYDFDRLRMELESSDGAGVGVIRYFIDGVLKATHTIAPHGSSMVPGFSLRNNTTAFRSIAADLFDLIWPRHDF